jgi:hypothetical protein
MILWNSYTKCCIENYLMCIEMAVIVARCCWEMGVRCSEGSRPDSAHILLDCGRDFTVQFCSRPKPHAYSGGSRPLQNVETAASIVEALAVRVFLSGVGAAALVGVYLGIAVGRDSGPTMRY